MILSALLQHYLGSSLFLLFFWGSAPLFLGLSQLPHPSIYLSTSVRAALCLIYLFSFEGCQHTWYRFGAVSYDSNWLHLCVAAAHYPPPSPPLRQTYCCRASAMTRLAFVLLPPSFFSSPHLASPPRHQSFSYWAFFIEIEVLITAQANLDLTEWSVPAKPSKFSPNSKSTRFYIFTPFQSNHLLLVYDRDGFIKKPISHRCGMETLRISWGVNNANITNPKTGFSPVTNWNVLCAEMFLVWRTR